MDVRSHGPIRCHSLNKRDGIELMLPSGPIDNRHELGDEEGLAEYNAHPFQVIWISLATVNQPPAAREVGNKAKRNYIKNGVKWSRLAAEPGASLRL